MKKKEANPHQVDAVVMPKVIMWGIRVKGRNFPSFEQQFTIFPDVAEDTVKRLGDRYERIKIIIQSA